MPAGATGALGHDDRHGFGSDRTTPGARSVCARWTPWPPVA
jgi:hypothetical protein